MIILIKVDRQLVNAFKYRVGIDNNVLQFNFCIGGNY